MTGPADQRRVLLEAFEAAVAAAHPRECLVPHLPDPPENGRLILLAAGKAAGSMTAVAERFYRERHGLGGDRLEGHAVTRHGYGEATTLVPVVEAGHPVPDQAGIEADVRGARPRGGRRSGRSRPGASLRRRLGQLDRSGRGADAGREAGHHPGAPALGSRDRRDQHGPQAPLADQGRPPRRARRAGPRADPRHLRCAA